MSVSKQVSGISHSQNKYPVYVTLKQVPGIRHSEKVLYVTLKTSTWYMSL